MKLTIADITHYKSGIIQIVVEIKSNDKDYVCTCNSRGSLQINFNNRLIIFNTSVLLDIKEYYLVTNTINHANITTFYIFQLTPYKLLGKPNFKERIKNLKNKNNEIQNKS